MATLGRRSFTAGNKIRYVLDYSAWLEDGTTLNTSAITCADANVIISGILVNPDSTVTFFVTTTLSTLFTLSIQTVNSKTEIKKDTIEFFVVTP